jgi:hypothetical protein
MCIRCEIDELLGQLCDCDESFECQWHKLLRMQYEVVRHMMRDAVDPNHYA